MWLLVYVPAVLGILRHRHWPYWRWVVAIFVWQSAAQFLFASHGSLEDPAGDGVIMRVMKRATNDGPELALFAVVFLVVFWGGIFYFVRQLYRAAKAPDLGVTAVRPVSKLRQGIELTVVTAVTAAMLYSTFAVLFASRTMANSETVADETTIEATIDRTVTSINAAAPHKLDDITVLTAASRDGRALIYDHTISDSRVTPALMMAYLNEGKLRETCADPDVRRLLADGGTLRLRYVLAAGGASIGRDFTSKDCSGP